MDRNRTFVDWSEPPLLLATFLRLSLGVSTTRQNLTQAMAALFLTCRHGMVRRMGYRCIMGGVLTFDAFATEVRSRLWVLEIEPAFQLGADIARYMWPPHTTEIQALDDRHARVAFSAHGQLVRTVQYVMDEASAKLVADGIIAVLEPDA